MKQTVKFVCATFFILFVFMGSEVIAAQWYDNYDQTPINDNNSTLIFLSVPDYGTITDIDVSVDLDHTYVSDLSIDVGHFYNGDWTWVNLFNYHGGNSENIRQIIFTDDGGEPINQANAPYGESNVWTFYQPTSDPYENMTNSLATFNGMEVNGEWCLAIYDMVSGDVGTVNNFGIYVETSSVPIPAAAWLLGSGLVGLVGARRKLRK